MTPDELAAFADTLRDLLEAEGTDRLQALLVETHPVDLARALRDLELPQQVTVFRHLSRDQAGAVLHEMDDQTILALVQALDEAELSGILDRMPPDNAAEVVSDLPEEQAEKLLDLMKREESEEVQELLRHGEKTAGRIMNPEFVAVHEEMTVAQALEHVRKAASAESIFYLYVVDDHDHLVGVLPIRRLITADPITPVHAISQRDVLSVTPEMDQEEVARLVTKHNLLAVPVVGRDNRLLGTITVDDVIDVIHAEHEEDVAAMVGSGAEELERLPTGRRAILRLPWLMVTIGIQLLGGLIIAQFHRTLGQVILLVSFMPLIQAIAGNTGLQSAAIVVRGLATGHVNPRQWRHAIWQQLKTTLVLGLICGTVVGFVGTFWQGHWVFGLVVGLSMFISINLSAITGTGFPMISKRLGFDPALTAGPFETAFQDVVGVSIYLGLATLLMRFLL